MFFTLLLIYCSCWTATSILNYQRENRVEHLIENIKLLMHTGEDAPVDSMQEVNKLFCQMSHVNPYIRDQANSIILEPFSYNEDIAYQFIKMACTVENLQIEKNAEETERNYKYAIKVSIICLSINPFSYSAKQIFFLSIAKYFRACSLHQTEQEDKLYHKMKFFETLAVIFATHSENPITAELEKKSSVLIKHFLELKAALLGFSIFFAIDYAVGLQRLERAYNSFIGDENMEKIAEHEQKLLKKVEAIIQHHDSPRHDRMKPMETSV